MYTPVSAVRSARFPLAGGLGCGCPSAAGLGQLAPAVGGLFAGAGIAGAGALGLVAGYFLGKHVQKVWGGQ